jgi:hypothetical protein
MLEKPNLKKDQPKKIKKIPCAKPENENADNWSDDQKKKSYYYDDSHGYEIYNLDEKDDDDTEEERSENPAKQ